MLAEFAAIITVVAAHQIPSLRHGATGAHLFAYSRPTLLQARNRHSQVQGVCTRRQTRSGTIRFQAELDLINSEADDCPTEEVSTQELVRFIIPTLGGWLSSEMMSVVDTSVVGSCSAAELAALGPATMIVDSSSYLFFWLNVATTSLFATALAGGDAPEAYRTLSDALWCALACGTLLTVLVGWLGPGALASICGTSAAEVVPAATSYLRVRMLGLPAFMAGMVMQAACFGARDPVSPLLVLLTCGGLNLFLDIYFVKTLAMGIQGAGLATLIAQLLQTALLAFVVQRKRAAAVDGERGWLLLRGRPSIVRLRNFLSFAGPIFLVLLGKISCYNAMTLVATTSGVAALAAHQAMFSIFFVGCKFGDAASQTAQAYLPSCVGLGDQRGTGKGGGQLVPSKLTPPPVRAQRLSSRLLWLSTLLGGTVSLLAYGIATRMPQIFSADAAVLSGMRGCAPLLFVALLLHATTMCSEGLLLGSRQLGFLAKAYAFNVAVFLSSLYAIARGGFGLVAVWKALAAFQLVRLLVFTGRLRRLGLAFGDAPARA
jgi:Na+-driven multidrug efflux pump